MKRLYTPPPRKVRRSAKTLLLAASAPIWAMVSNSERPSSSFSARMRKVGGMSTSSWSMDSTPIAASISSRSSGEWTRYGISAGPLACRALGELFVGGLVHQVAWRGPRHVDCLDPAIAIRVRGHELGLGRKLVVDG